jgi:hypothetical protein
MRWVVKQVKTQIPLNSGFFKLPFAEEDEEERVLITPTVECSVNGDHHCQHLDMTLKQFEMWQINWLKDE